MIMVTGRGRPSVSRGRCGAEEAGRPAKRLEKTAAGQAAPSLGPEGTSTRGGLPGRGTTAAMRTRLGLAVVGLAASSSGTGAGGGDLTGSCGPLHRPAAAADPSLPASPRVYYTQGAGTAATQLAEMRNSPQLHSYWGHADAVPMHASAALSLSARAELLQGLNFSALLQPAGQSARATRLRQSLDTAKSAVGHCAAYLSEGEAWCERLAASRLAQKDDALAPLASLLLLATEVGGIGPAALVAAVDDGMSAGRVSHTVPGELVTALLSKVEQRRGGSDGDALWQRGEAACLHALAPGHAAGQARKQLVERMRVLLSAQHGLGLLSGERYLRALVGFSTTTPGRYYFLAAAGTAALRQPRPTAELERSAVGWLSAALAALEHPAGEPAGA